ncbi:hypothetical protein AT575_03880 [Streptococcus penaeicida]|uniref:CsbD-like domain-containing protein n=1 Tax=Streptococcus penaeicida TaxID=1765960 RepID=A0A2N8LCY8_9STRE|nr:CsbD family protein [Streptococcus penaeicida]PND48024.1 hypothetical protein AT575_03880 [Streptococcus penaeicida]
MTDEKMKAKLEQASGSVKESIGKVSGNKSLETEGKMNKISGNVREVKADTKDTIDGISKGLQNNQEK